MKIYVICSVRGASEEYRKNLEDYTAKLESEGHEVHLPHRDTNQDATGFEICLQNMNATKDADEIHIFYSSESTGTHFDLGMAFVLQKPIVVVETESFDYVDENGEYKKSFPLMLEEWQDAELLV